MDLFKTLFSKTKTSTVQNEDNSPVVKKKKTELFIQLKCGSRILSTHEGDEYYTFQFFTHWWFEERTPYYWLNNDEDNCYMIARKNVSFFSIEKK